MQQRLLKSADFTNRPTNLYVKNSIIVLPSFFLLLKDLKRLKRLKDSVYEDFAAGRIGLHQEGRGPAGIFGQRIMLSVRAG